MAKIILLQDPYSPDTALDIKIGQRIASLLHRKLLRLEDYLDVMNLNPELKELNLVRQYTSTQLQLLQQRCGAPIIEVLPY